MRALLLALLASLSIVSQLRAEKPATPKALLWQEPFVVDVTILSIEVKPGPHAGSSVWHRVRIDRVDRGEGLEVGAETAVVSRTYTLAPGTAGTIGHRGGWKGPNGLPIRGDRARIFASGTASTLQPHFVNGWQPIEPVISFVAADDEYRSEITMPFLAALATPPIGATKRLHLATDRAPSGGPNRTPKVDAKTNLTESYALREADVVVAYMRFEQLDDDTRGEFLRPLDGGTPLVAFRTTTHAFAYPEGHPAASLNNGFGEKFLGSPWRFHHGHSSRTRILPPDAERAEHPILSGVTIPSEGIVVPSWLYHVEPLPADCTVLLWGEAVDSERKDAPQKQPILWVREIPKKSSQSAESEKSSPPQRIAYTSLGHPGDFASAEVRVIAAQMLAWAARRSDLLTKDECAVIRAASFSPPNTR